MENTIVLLSAKLIIVASRDSVVPPLRTDNYNFSILVMMVRTYVHRVHRSIY